MTYTWITATGAENTFTGDLGNQIISYNYLSTSTAAQTISLAINAATTTVTGIPGIANQTIDNTVEGTAFFGNVGNDSYTFNFNSGATAFRHIEIRSGDGNDSVTINGVFAALDSRSGGVSYGTNFFDGGSGYDTVTLQGNQADYIIEDTADVDARRRFLIREAGGGNAHLDLYDIEKIVFANGSQYIGPPVANSGDGGGSNTTPTAGPTTTSQSSTSPTTTTSQTTPAVPSTKEGSPILGMTSQTTVTTVQLTNPIKLGTLQVKQAVVGTAARDLITGSNQGEALTGGLGRDRITGGGGPDAFVFETPGEFGSKNIDVITDFNSDEGDKLAISSAIFGNISTIRLRTVSSKKETRQAASSGSQFIYDAKTGFLYFDANGKNSGFGNGGEFAQLLGAPKIDRLDFVIA